MSESYQRSGSYQNPLAAASPPFWPQITVPAAPAAPAAPGVPGWQPSAWHPGMPPTQESVDTSRSAWPTPAQIEAQRQLITANLRKYGYQPQALSDAQVLSTMSNLPQAPVQWPPWVESYLQQHPEERGPGARPGVDIPFNQTFEEGNLAYPALNRAQPTQVGYGYATPRGAIYQHGGQPALDAYDRQMFESIGGHWANAETATYGLGGDYAHPVITHPGDPDPVFRPTPIAAQPAAPSSRPLPVPPIPPPVPPNALQYSTAQYLPNALSAVS